MKKLIYFIPLILILLSCGTTYIEVYYVEKFPLQWVDTVKTECLHWHYRDDNKVWYCIEDSVEINIYQNKDTIYLPIFMGRYRKEGYNKVLGN
jgi:hypothetical protein